MSTVGNGRHAAVSWITANLSTIIIVACGVVANIAVQWDRGGRNSQDIIAAEQRLNERFTALSVRLTSAEEKWGNEHDTNYQQTNDLNAFQARLQADQQTRDVRTKARDDQIDAIQRDVRALQDNDRLTGQWQATINERLVGVVQELQRISRLLEQRLPDPPPAPATRR